MHHLIDFIIITSCLHLAVLFKVHSEFSNTRPPPFPIPFCFLQILSGEYRHHGWPFTRHGTHELWIFRLRACNMRSCSLPAATGAHPDQILLCNRDLDLPNLTN